MIRIKIKKGATHKVTKRLKNKARIRKKVSGTVERPRLAVFKSSRHIYAQLIDDVTSKTLVSVSSLSEEVKGSKKTDAAKKIGAALAKKAMEQKITSVVFDRSGYVFHGRIKAIADGAREAGLNF